MVVMGFGARVQIYISQVYVYAPMAAVLPVLFTQLCMQAQRYSRVELVRGRLVIDLRIKVTIPIVYTPLSSGPAVLCKSTDNTVCFPNDKLGSATSVGSRRAVLDTSTSNSDTL